MILGLLLASSFALSSTTTRSLEEQRRNCEWCALSLFAWSASLALPEYTLVRPSDGRLAHAIRWEVPIGIVAFDSVLESSTALDIFPGRGLAQVSTVLRAVGGGAEVPAQIGFGLGAFAGGFGFGPMAEVRFRLGRVRALAGGGGLFLSGAAELDLSERAFGFQLATGIDYVLVP